MIQLRFDQWMGVVAMLVGIGLLAGQLWPVQTPATAVVLPADWQLAGVNPVPVMTLPSGQVASSAAVIEQMTQFAATLSAQAIYVMDVPSASVLLAKQPTEPRFPASTTKLLTALVALDTYSPKQVLTVKAESQTEGTVMGLQTGENLTVQSLLAGLLIQSGNDAAQVLAGAHDEGAARRLQAALKVLLKR